MLQGLFLQVFVLLFPQFAFSQHSPSIFPAVAPLAVRSPYFNCWVTGAAPMSNWPVFWNGAILGWNGLIRVDGVAYQWLGQSSTNPNLTTFSDVKITPTRTIYDLQAGPMNVTITFLTPIEVSDPVLQSLPFSYVFLEAKSADGQPHNVQAYSDISAEWSSGDRGQVVTWNTTKTDTSTRHQIQLQNPKLFEEHKDQAEDTTTYYAMRSGPSVTSTAVRDTDSRSAFAGRGALPTPQFNTTQIINSPFVVFAIAADLGNITQTDEPVVWAVGVVRNPSITFTNGSGISQTRAPLYTTRYLDTEGAIDAFLLDFDDARKRSLSFDAQVLNETSRISPQLSDLASLAMRQTIGATELTVTSGVGGQLNLLDIKMFMKDVGDSRRINPVEKLYSAFPFFLYVNASYAGYLLSPLLEYQNSPQYNMPYAAKDLGDTYPLATGSNRPHTQGIEQSGNMLVMVLAHAQVSGDGTLIHRHYNLLKSWADYLINNTQTPSQQSTADLSSRANMTNLIVKGVIGVGAMAKISEALGRSDDASTYSRAASVLTSTWQSLALSPDGSYLLATYGAEQSWTLPYNLYADRLLHTNTISDNIYQNETNFLGSLVISPGIPTNFGLPIDTITISQANSAWTMFTAAITTDPSIRDALIKPIWDQASNRSGIPFASTFKIDTGDVISGRSSPAQGAMLAPLALTLPVKEITFSLTSQSQSTKRSIIGPVIGGVLGGLILMLGVALAIFYLRRRAHSHNQAKGVRVDAEDPNVRTLNMAEADPGVQVYSLARPQSPQHWEFLNDTRITEPPVEGFGGVTISSKGREVILSLGQQHRWAEASVITDGNASRSVFSREPPTDRTSSIPLSPGSTQGTMHDQWAEAQKLQQMTQIAERADSPSFGAPPSYAE